MCGAFVFVILENNLDVVESNYFVLQLAVVPSNQ